VVITTRAFGEDARWGRGRIAIRATEAKTQLLQDIGLIERKIGTLFIDDGKKADRVRRGEELQGLFDSITVDARDLVIDAERAYKYGDAAAAEGANLEARYGVRSTNGDG
jgi:hypothetical protein